MRLESGAEREQVQGPAGAIVVGRATLISSAISALLSCSIHDRAKVDSILGTEIARRQRRVALAAFVDRLDVEFGQPDSV